MASFSSVEEYCKISEGKKRDELFASLGKYQELIFGITAGPGGEDKIMDDYYMPETYTKNSERDALLDIFSSSNTKLQNLSETEYDLYIEVLNTLGYNIQLKIKEIIDRIIIINDIIRETILLGTIAEIENNQKISIKDISGKLSDLRAEMTKSKQKTNVKTIIETVFSIADIVITILTLGATRLTGELGYAVKESISTASLIFKSIGTITKYFLSYSSNIKPEFNSYVQRNHFLGALSAFYSSDQDKDIQDILESLKKRSQEKIMHRAEEDIRKPSVEFNQYVYDVILDEYLNNQYFTDISNSIINRSSGQIFSMKPVYPPPVRESNIDTGTRFYENIMDRADDIIFLKFAYVSLKTCFAGANLQGMTNDQFREYLKSIKRQEEENIKKVVAPLLLAGHMIRGQYDICLYNPYQVNMQMMINSGIECYDHTKFGNTNIEFAAFIPKGAVANGFNSQFKLPYGQDQNQKGTFYHYENLYDTNTKIDTLELWAKKLYFYKNIPFDEENSPDKIIHYIQCDNVTAYLTRRYVSDPAKKAPYIKPQQTASFTEINVFELYQEIIKSKNIDRDDVALRRLINLALNQTLIFWQNGGAIKKPEKIKKIIQVDKERQTTRKRPNPIANKFDPFSTEKMSKVPVVQDRSYKH